MESVGVGLDDRGLNYGDGLFETVRVGAGVAPLWPRHRQRLLAGADRLAITVNADALEQAFLGACRELDDGVLKVLLTRGSGGRGYGVDPSRPSALRLVPYPLRLPPPERYRDGLALGLCDLRLASQPPLAGIKHLNRLEQVLARQQVDAAGWDDGLLCGQEGEPLELTAMNLFARYGDRLWTPDLSRAGVAGVMRSHILDVLAPARGLAVQVATGTLSQLQQADEVFACNSVAGILPVRKLALWTWPVGELTRAWQHQVNQLFSGG